MAVNPKNMVVEVTEELACPECGDSRLENVWVIKAATGREQTLCPTCFDKLMERTPRSQGLHVVEWREVEWARNWNQKIRSRKARPGSLLAEPL